MPLKCLSSSNWNTYPPHYSKGTTANGQFGLLNWYLIETKPAIKSVSSFLEGKKQFNISLMESIKVR